MVNLSVSEQNLLYKRKTAFFKLILSYGVIQTHALNYDVYRLSEMTGLLAKTLLFLEKRWYSASLLIIPAFFFLSGFSYFSGYSYEKTLDKFKNRVFTLLIPWVSWNTIMWLFALTVRKIPAIASRMNSLPAYEFTLRSWLIDGLYHSADGPMWFMFNLMAAVLLSPFIYTLIRHKYVGLVSFVCAFAAAWYWNFYHYSVFMTTLLFAEAGYYAIHLRPLCLRRYARGTRLGALALLLLYLVLYRTEASLYGGLFYALAATFCVPALWVLLGDVELKGFWKKVDAYRFWNYGAHYFPLECVEKLWLIVAGGSAGAAAADFILAPIVTIALLIAIAVPVRKFCPTLWKLLNGAYFPEGIKKQSAR